MAFNIKNDDSNHPVLRILGLLFLGFSTGVGGMALLNDHLGMVLKFKVEDNQTIKNLSECNKKSIQLSKVNRDLSSSIEKTKPKLERLNKKLRNLNTIEIQLSESNTGIKILEKELSKEKNLSKSLKHEASLSLKRKKENQTLQNKMSLINVELNKTRKDNSNLNNDIAILKKKNKVLSHPIELAIPTIIYQKYSFSPNTLVEYFDGAITLVAESISRTRACLKTNLNDSCKFIRTGGLLVVNTGSKEYGFRVDRLFVPHSFTNETDATNKVTITVLLLKNS